MNAPSHPSRFLQIHTLTSYAAALLNRDDAGFAKRLPFGGAVRTRVSSQCLKRHWRRAEGEHSLQHVPGPDGDLPMTVRSRRTFEQEVYGKLVEEGIATNLARAATEALMDTVLQKSKSRAASEDAEAAEGDGGTEDLRTGQVLVIGRPEVDYFLQVAREAITSHDDPKAVAKAVAEAFKKDGKKDGKKNLDALIHGAGLDAALFGRMITSDVLARCDAAIHVAHAFTVHAEEAESDYFSAVDDLAQEGGETGSGHINSSELTSGLFYGYVVVDVPLLVSNLTGCKQDAWREADRELAAEVIQRLLHLVSTVSPGAKLGSTAPYAHAHLMLVEAGSEAPRTLANAFLQPVRSLPPANDLLGATYAALAEHVEQFDGIYGAPSDGRRGFAAGSGDTLRGLLGESTSLRDLARWAAERVA